MGRCQVSKHKYNHCKLPWKHKLHLLVTEGRWSHPPTQSCPDPHRHRISQSKSPILLPDGQGENHFCISWQGEHHNWDHLLWRKQGFGLCLLRWERRKHGTLCGCCFPWLQHISRSCPVPSSGGKSARWLVSCWSMMLSLQVLRTCRRCQLPWLDAAVRTLFVGRKRQKQWRSLPYPRACSLPSAPGHCRWFSPGCHCQNLLSSDRASSRSQRV